MSDRKVTTLPGFSTVQERMLLELLERPFGELVPFMERWPNVTVKAMARRGIVLRRYTVAKGWRCRLSDKGWLIAMGVRGRNESYASRRGPAFKGAGGVLPAIASASIDPDKADTARLINERNGVA